MRNTLKDSPLQGDTSEGRMDVGRLLERLDRIGRVGSGVAVNEHETAEQVESAGVSVLRSVLDHPRLVPYFTEFLGRGYRMDHLPFAILQNKG